jgi:hypothetical protein
VPFFFHSPEYVPEIAGARNEMVVVVSFQIGAGSPVYTKPFTDPNYFGELLREAETKAGVPLRPITLGGGAQGVARSGRS